MSQSDNTIGTADISEVLSKSIDSLGNYQYKDGEPDTARLAGLVEMDIGIVNAVNTAVASFGHLISKKVSPHVYEVALKTGGRLNTMLGSRALSQTALNRVAGGLTLATNLTLFLGEPVSKLFHDMSSQHDIRTDMNRQLRQVYDSLGDAKSNTVVAAQRRRMGKEATTTNMNTILTGLGSNLLNLLGEGVNVEAMMSGEHRNVIYQRNNDELATRFREEIETANEKANRKPMSERLMDNEIRKRIDKEHSSGSLLGFVGGGALLSKLFQAQAKSSQRRLEHKRQPYSAYEMIVGLQQQLANNPGKNSRFALPGRRGGELPLAQYIATIFTIHQKELLDSDKDQAEIRDALKEDLLEASKALAARIEAGELDPMTLLRLVGEGEIVKNKGRGLASVDEVNTLIDRFASAKAQGLHEDPKTYFPKRAFTEAAIKEDLGYLDGEERLLFASAIPDKVLRLAGMNEKEIKEVQVFRASEVHDQMLAAVLKGMDEKGEESLRQGGLGQTQIRQVKQAGEAIDRDGVEAVAKLKTSATHAEGAENLMTDFVANQIPQNKLILSTLVNEGRQAMDNAREKGTPAANDHDGKPVGSHAEKFKPKTRAEHANEDYADTANDDFAEREISRRQHGSGFSHAHK